MMRMATSSSLTATAAATKAQLFETYHQQLLREFTANIRANINIRLDAVEQIVNHGLPDCFARFEIQTNLRNDIMLKIEPEIDDKTKVQHKSCTKQIKSIKDYKNVARNRLNRNKPKFLGNFVYGEIIFKKLYPHIYQQCKLHNYPDIDIMKLFINVLILIFENHAQFTQTKPQPIITYNTLVNENLFKSGCINLLKLYQIPPVLYQTEKRKSSKKKAGASSSGPSPATNKPKEPAKRDKAKMAFQKIVNAMKLINDDQKLRSVPVPGPASIITGHDTRKNKTYNNTICTPPSMPSPVAVPVGNTLNYGGYNNTMVQPQPQQQTYTFTPAQYIPNSCNATDGLSNSCRNPHVPHPVMSQNTVSFGSSSNMTHNTHFGVHPDGNSSSDEMQSASTRSTNSGDRDQNSSPSGDSGMSREYSSSISGSASHSSANIHIADGNYDSYGVNINSRYPQNQYEQTEYPAIPVGPVGNGQIITDVNQHNNYQQTQIIQPQTQPIYSNNNNNNNGIVFNEEYKQTQTTPITHNHCTANNISNNNMNNMNNMSMNMAMNNNNNYNNNMNNSTFNNGLNNFNNVNMTGDNQCGVMLSGADLGINNNSMNNNYNGYDQQVPIINEQSFVVPQTQIMTPTQEQTPEISQYGHHHNTCSTLNRNIMNNNNGSIYNMDNNMMNNNNLSSTNVFGGFDTNSICNNVNVNAFDTNSITMNMNNNLSTNQVYEAPIIIDEINSAPINSPTDHCIGYGPSRGRSRTTNVSSLRYSPLSLPAPRTQPVTISNPFNTYAPNTNTNNVNTVTQNNIINTNTNTSNGHYQVPFPFGHNNDTNNNSMNYNNNNNNGVYTQNYGNY